MGSELQQAEDSRKWVTRITRRRLLFVGIVLTLAFAKVVVRAVLSYELEPLLGVPSWALLAVSYLPTVALVGWGLWGWSRDWHRTRPKGAN